MTTKMKRFTISIPVDLEAGLDALKQEDFYDKPKSEMYRILIALGIERYKIDMKEEGKEAVHEEP